MKTGYFQFDAGVNYRDDVMGINELRDGKNLYWRGNLKRRAGYEQRSANLVSGSSDYPYVKGIYEQVRLETNGIDQHVVFAGLAGACDGNVAMVLPYYKTGLATATGSSYTQLSSAYAVFWGTGDPINAVVMDDKVWLALGDPNPYIYYSASDGMRMYEYPICKYTNTGTYTGANIIPNTTSTVAGTNLDWGNTDLVIAGDGYVYISDGKSIFWGISEAGVRSDLAADFSTWTLADRSSAIKGNISTAYGTPGWAVNQFTGLEENLKIVKAETYKKYVFLYGEGGIVSFYQRGLYSNDFDKIVETHEGVTGKLITTEKGVFYVGKDGIYGFDGQAATDLGKKIWPNIKKKHATVPTDFDDCNLAYHDGFVWIFFPHSGETYVFDPDNIYDDERGDSHAPFYRFEYEKNLIYDGDCESTAEPTLNHSYNVAINSSWVRTATNFKTGSYAWILEKTVAAGAGEGYEWLHETNDVDDLHELLPGETYDLGFWGWRDTGSNATHGMQLYEYYGSSWNLTQTWALTTSGSGAWENYTTHFTLSTRTEGIRFGPVLDNNSSDNSFVIIDQLEVKGPIAWRNSLAIDDKLFVTDLRNIYELDVKGKDDNAHDYWEYGINFDMRSAYLDQEQPNLKKVYRQVIPETNEGIADGTTDGAHDLQVACSIDHSTGVLHRGIDTGIDLEYTTDIGHVVKTLDVPETTDGYILDGNSMSVEIIGETSNVTPTTGSVDIFGFSLDYDVRQRAKEEVSS